MKAKRESLDGSQIDQLVVTDPEASDLFAGERVAFICTECWQSDETLDQIWHKEDCSLCGEHGREHYDELEPDVPGRPTPEFDPEHEISVIKAAESSGRTDPCRHEVLAFRCSCGNADEDVFEIVHDEACPLAGHNRLSSSRTSVQGQTS